MRFRGQTDLVLLHPPSVYDFRKMLVIPSPMADLVPSGPFFEMYPIGFSFLGEYLERHGMKVRVINLAARMLSEPDLDVELLIKKLDPRAFGIGLHWLPHAHGALEIARLCQKAHPDTPVIMGGYSASIYHQELMEHPEVDYVVRGDSAEEPLRQLMTAVRDPGTEVSSIPNITYRGNGASGVVSTPLDFVPRDLSHLGDNYAFMVRSAVREMDPRGIKAFKGWWSYPVSAVLTVKGCLNNCAFCGGSARAMGACFGRKGLALRDPADVATDVSSLASITGAPIFVIGDIRQPGEDYAGEVLDRLARLDIRNHVVLELFKPAPRDFFERAGRALPHFDLEMSPETHDDTLRRLAGKPYTALAVEQNVEWAVDCGCGKFDVFFMIGIEGQTPASVMDTIAYCGELLARFGSRVNPLIGPLAPFLDPGSIAREEAASHGYRVLLHTLEDHRRALEEPHWRDLLGYDTQWMSRQDIVDATYDALLELNRIKSLHGHITPEYAGSLDRFLKDGVALLARLDRARAGEDENLRDAELVSIKREADALLRRGEMVKDELLWPVEGRRFRYGGIARMMLRNRRAR
ncbi:MAG: TIGR04190 family B12-binding domain/radical SAM domain protein [Candidatus Geothermincolia bacterium]